MTISLVDVTIWTALTQRAKIKLRPSNITVAEGKKVYALMIESATIYLDVDSAVEIIAELRQIVPDTFGQEPNDGTPVGAVDENEEIPF